MIDLFLGLVIALGFFFGAISLIAWFGTYKGGTR